MKYSLRSLMIAAILGPPLLAGGHYFFMAYGSALKGYMGWLEYRGGSAVAFAGAVFLAVLLIRMLGRASPTPLD